jgi:hypothetical protein
MQRIESQGEIAHINLKRFITARSHRIESVRTPLLITSAYTETGLWAWRCPRHFVPGYGRTVPSGTFRDRSLWAPLRRAA